MSQCKECGATLPENSRFCLQCGTENRPAAGSSQPARDLDFLKPAITGGLALGVLASIPFISALNLICCLWAQVGGGISTWLLEKQRPGGLKYGDGAFAGVFSGLVGAIVSTLINIPIQILLMTPERLAQAQQALEQAQGIPPALREAILRFMTPGFDLSRTLILLVMYMVLYGLFAMIGGIITVAILSRKKLD